MIFRDGCRVVRGARIAGSRTAEHFTSRMDLNPHLPGSEIILLCQRAKERSNVGCRKASNPRTVFAYPKEGMGVVGRLINPLCVMQNDLSEPSAFNHETHRAVDGGTRNRIGNLPAFRGKLCNRIGFALGECQFHNRASCSAVCNKGFYRRTFASHRADAELRAGADVNAPNHRGDVHAHGSRPAGRKHCVSGRVSRRVR